MKPVFVLISQQQKIPYNKGIYKSYKFDCYGGENLRVKPYHILEFEHNGDIWGYIFSLL